MKYRIALSNGGVGSEWRTRMIEEAQAAAAASADKGVGIEALVRSWSVDVQGRIADVGNFVIDGVNAIIIKPNSPTAFNPTFAKAGVAGIAVLSTGSEIASPDATSSGSTRRNGQSCRPGGCPTRSVARDRSSASADRRPAGEPGACRRLRRGFCGLS